ncbi:MAG: hypothetical protein GXO99_01930, partial [Nitrospirae bacterium]|nr:hypothetical protein [Nitrospirota bacterium]
MFKKLISLFLFAAPLFLIGCVATTTDMDMLQNDVVVLTQKYNRQQKELKLLREELKALKTSTKKQAVTRDTFNALREGQLALNDRISEIDRDLQSLQNRIDESLFRIEKALSDAETERSINRAQIDQAMSEITKLKKQFEEINKKVEELSKLALAIKKPEQQVEKPKPREKPKPQKPEDFYNIALEKLRQGKTV